MTGSVTSNDSDPESPTLTYTIANPPIEGDLNLNLDGTFSYTPDENFHGTVSFDYTVTDDEGESDSATVNILVNPVNDDPIAEDDFETTTEDNIVNVPLMTNDHDADGNPLTVTEINGVSILAGETMPI